MPETGPTDDLLRRLLAAVAAETSDAHVEQLIANARAEAESEIAALVKSAYKALLLRRATEHLEAFTNTNVASPTAAASPQQQPPAVKLGRSAESDDGSACYIYAITPATEQPLADDVPAIDPRHALEVVRHDGVQAIVSAVALDEFSQAALDERVTDPQWVEEKVRAHDRVIKSAMAAGAGDGAGAGGGAVIPCRFCTVVRSVEDVRALLAANHNGIAATLEALHGKQEWGVKIYADLATLARHLRNSEARTGDDAASSGRSYLERKRHEDTTRSDAERLARAQAEECHTVIAAAAADATLLARRPRAGNGGGDGGGDGAGVAMLNAAYLVAEDDVNRFHDIVAALAERYQPLGIEFEVTGPWPPYNFVRLDLSLQQQQAVA